MKKLMMFAFATMLITGGAFAGDGKKCGKGKECSKKEEKKASKAETKKETAVVIKKA